MPVFFRCARVRMRCVAPTFRAKTILPSDGRRFGKRKQGILDKLSRRGLRMRRKADADNSRIGASSGRCRLLSLDFFACSCAFVESTDGDSAEYAVRSNLGGLLASVRCRGRYVLIGYIKNRFEAVPESFARESPSGLRMRRIAGDAEFPGRPFDTFVGAVVACDDQRHRIVFPV